MKESKWFLERKNKMKSIQHSALSFISDLKSNNNRDWFAENKQRYEVERGHFIDFAENLLEKMRQHDDIETVSGKKSLFRIYRDVRFSKDKSPYKTHFSGSFKRATKLLRGGYYFHIEPNGNSFVGGGFWSPNKEDLARIREEIASDDASKIRSIVSEKNFVHHFGELKGEQLKTAPKGYPKDHSAIEFLRYKQFLLMKPFSDEEVMSENFSQQVNETFKAMRPFFDYMSEVLTTDSNGEVIV